MNPHSAMDFWNDDLFSPVRSVPYLYWIKIHSIQIRNFGSRIRIGTQVFFVWQRSEISQLKKFIFSSSRLETTSRGAIFKLLKNPGIDSKVSSPPACVAWRAGTTTLLLLGSLPPIDCCTIPAQLSTQGRNTGLSWRVYLSLLSF